MLLISSLFILIMSRRITNATRKKIAGRQSYKCANRPKSNLKGLENYKCPLWQKQEDRGSFDESGFEIDHIIEHCLTADDSDDNLQALCKSCHNVKTKRFNSESKRQANSETIRQYLTDLGLEKLKHVCLMLGIKSDDNMDKIIKCIMLEKIPTLAELKRRINAIPNKKYAYICHRHHIQYSDDDYHKTFKKIEHYSDADAVGAVCDACRKTAVFTRIDNPFYDTDIDAISEDYIATENDDDTGKTIKYYLKKFNLKQLNQLQWMLGIINTVENSDNHRDLVQNILDYDIKIDHIEKIILGCRKKKYMYKCYGPDLDAYHIFFAKEKLKCDYGKCSDCGDNSFMLEYRNQFFGMVNNKTVVEI